MCKYLLVALFFCGLKCIFASECKKVGDCSCEFFDGSGVNLSILQASNSLPLQANATNGDVYFFSPCKDLNQTSRIEPAPTNVTDNDCAKGYTLCRFINATQKFTVLGQLKDSQFTGGQDDGGLFLTYTNNSARVKLVCARDKSTYFFPGAEEKETTNLLLFSPHACPVTIEDFSKPSTGTVLLIMLFVAFVSYFVIGATVNAFYLGARGMEIFPHLDFWRDLPNLVRDGAVYLQNGCRVTSQAPNPDSYDAI